MYRPSHGLLESLCLLVVTSTVSRGRFIVILPPKTTANESFSEPNPRLTLFLAGLPCHSSSYYYTVLSTMMNQPRKALPFMPIRDSDASAGYSSSHLYRLRGVSRVDATIMCRHERHKTKGPGSIHLYRVPLMAKAALASPCADK